MTLPFFSHPQKWLVLMQNFFLPILICEYNQDTYFFFVTPEFVFSLLVYVGFRLEKDEIRKKNFQSQNQLTSLKAILKEFQGVEIIYLL